MEITEEVFNDNNIYSNATLYVPTGRTKFYKSAAVWGKFSTIKELDMEGVYISASSFDNIEANQMSFGHYVSKDSASADEGGYGGSYAGTYKACIGFSKEYMNHFAGNHISNVRFALTDATGLTDVKLWISKSKYNNPDYTQSISTLRNGWNEFALTTPYELTGDSVFIGIQYTAGSQTYPISAVRTGAEEGSFYLYGPYNEDNSYTWIDESSYSFSLQCIVEGEKLPQYLIWLKNPSAPKYLKVGENASGYAYLKNIGKNSISSYDIKLLIDGKDVGFTTPYSHPTLSRDDYSNVYYEGIVPTSLSAGKHNLTTEVTAINEGKPEYDENSQVTQLKVYSKSFDRKYVVMDHLTAQWCQFCPRLDREIDDLLKQNNDIIVISSQVSDNLSCEASEAYSIFTSYYPNYFYDRYSEAGATTLGYTSLENARKQPSLIKLTTTAKSGSNGNISINVEGERNDEFLAVEGESNLTVLVVEDSVDGYQADYNAGTTHEHYNHNGVIRTNASAIWGDPIQWDGNSFNMSFSVPLNPEWKVSNLKVVAFASHPYNGNLGDINIMNSDQTKVTQDATGISSVRNDVDTETVAIYDAMGRKIDKPVKGVNILRYNNGKSQKVIVK